MNIDALRERFPDENACRRFFESVYGEMEEAAPVVFVKSHTA